MIHDLIGKKISILVVDPDNSISLVEPDMKIHFLSYSIENEEDVSFKTNFGICHFLTDILKDIQHSYFLDEDRLTTNEKYVFIFESGLQFTTDWDIHYKSKDDVHTVDYEEIE